MPKFRVLSGEMYEIEAKDAEEAEQKYYALLMDEDCPCGDFLCKCYEEIETQTWVQEC